TDQPLRISVLPWRPWRDRPIPYTHCSKPLDDDIAIDAIPITNDISWRLLPAVGFGQLTRNPMGAGACGHSQPQKLAAGMLQYQKPNQQPKRDRRDYEKIHRRNAVSVITQKGLPALRRWLPSPRHVFCHGGLPDIDAKLEQFAVNPWCSPKRVRGAHVANELANVRRRLWPAAARSGLPAPIGSETSAVPADHRLRLENFQCVQYSRSYTIEPRKHQAVNIAERQSLRGFAPLVSKDQDLCFQRSPRPEQSDQGAPDQPAKIAHRQQVSRFAVAVSGFGFAVGTAHLRIGRGAGTADGGLGAAARHCSSPGELGPVSEAMLESATRLCGAKVGILFSYRDGAYIAFAKLGVPPEFAEHMARGPIRPGPDTGLGRIIKTKQAFHIIDTRAERAYESGDPWRVATAELLRARSLLNVPMLKNGKLVGAIGIYREEVRPFTDSQIALVTNFAHQAVIAIENVRLFDEIQDKSRQLAEASQRKTQFLASIS